MLVNVFCFFFLFFFQAEDGIRDLVRSRGLGDVYKRQPPSCMLNLTLGQGERMRNMIANTPFLQAALNIGGCLLYTSDAADERSSVDLGGRRIIKKKRKKRVVIGRSTKENMKRQT